MNGPTRVLLVIKGLGPGGAERLLISVARATRQKALAYEAAYVLPWKDHLVGELAGAGVPSHLVGGRRGLTDPRWVWRLRRLVRRFEVVYVHSPVLAAVLRPIIRTMRNRPALVVIDHNSWRSWGRVTRFVNRATVALDDVHLAVSDPVRDSMPPRARARARVVVHGVPVDALSTRRGEREARRATLGLGEHDVAITTVANLRWTKDYPTLLRAAAVVVEQHPNARFFAAGQGPLAEQTATAVTDLGLGDRFRLLGYVDDTPALLAASDVFVLASRVEGLPIALIEAMAMGLPAVATAVGGTPTAMTDGVEGHLVPARDPDAMARAIGALVADPAARATMGAAALTRAREFDIANAATELAGIFEEAGR